MEKYELIIIGGGISGLTAAIYAARKRMNFLIIASDYGGQFKISGEILNYPGVLKTSGMELLSEMKKQMEHNGIKVMEETVKEAKKNGIDFEIITDKGTYKTKTVLIATGSKPRKLNVEGEETFKNKGVTYCSICDGPLFSGMDVAVVGSGASALEAIDFMKDIAGKIYLLVRSGKLKGHEYLQERAKKNEKVEIMYNTKIREILGDKFVSGVIIDENGTEKRLDLRGVIVEVGRIPTTGVFKGFVDIDEDGHIQVDFQGHASVPGVFAAGDCASGHEYQYVIAAGQGAMALLKAAKYLADRED